MNGPEDSMTLPVRVLLVDDEPLLRRSLRIVIDSQADLSVVGEAATGTQAVQAAKDFQPDVILMDIRMPDSDGIHATREITSAVGSQNIRVLVLSMHELDEYVYGALRAGASGFLLKDAQPTQLLDAIRRVYAGEALFAPSILTKLVEHYIAGPAEPVQPENDQVIGRLTPRETEVLTLVGRGLSNDEITAELHISGNTVKSHISSLLAKLYARDRAQLVIAAYQFGLVRISPLP